MPVARLDGQESLAVTRGQNDAWSPGQSGQLVGQIRAATIRKPDVDQHGVWSGVLRDEQRLRGVCCGPHRLDSDVRQDPGDEREKRRIIVHDKH